MEMRWASYVGYDSAAPTFRDERRRVYAHALDDTFHLGDVGVASGGTDMREVMVPEGTVPLFGAVLSASDHGADGAPSSDIVAGAERLLAVCGHTYVVPEHCPQLADATLLLRSHLAEPVAYAVLMTLLKDKRRYLMTSERDQLSYGWAFEGLVTARYKKTARHLRALNLTCGPLFERWAMRFFVDVLPYPVVGRVFAAYLEKGMTVLFRVGLALFRLHKRAMKRVFDPLRVFGVVTNAIMDPGFDADGMLKVAFKLRLSERRIRGLMERWQGRPAVQRDPAPYPHSLPMAPRTPRTARVAHRPKLLGGKTLLFTPVLCMDLSASMPREYRTRDYELIFSTSTDSYSLQAMADAVKSKHPTVILVQPAGPVSKSAAAARPPPLLGAFVSHTWSGLGNQGIGIGRAGDGIAGVGALLSTRSTGSTGTAGSVLSVEGGSPTESFVFRLGSPGAHNLDIFPFGTVDTVDTAPGAAAPDSATAVGAAARVGEEETEGTKETKEGEGGDREARGGPVRPALSVLRDCVFIGSAGHDGNRPALTLDASLRHGHAARFLAATAKGEGVGASGLDFIIGVVEVFHLRRSPHVSAQSSSASTMGPTSP